MGLVEFFLLCVVVVILAALTVWCINTFAPATPAVIIKAIWFVAALIIVVTLLKALGLFGVDPQIPRLFSR